MRTRSFVSLLLTAVAWAPAAQASVFMFAASADPKLSPDANGGTVDVWTVTVTGSSSESGSFLGDSKNNGSSPPSGAGAGSSAWALYANQSQGAARQAWADAHLTSLVGAPVGQAGDSISLDFDNGDVDGGRFVGVQFYGDSSFTTLVAELSLTGGLSKYQWFDGGATHTSQLINATDFTVDGFTLQLAFTDNFGSFDLTLGSTSFANRTLASGATSMAGVRVFNFTAGASPASDVYFNNLTITTTSVVPEASIIWMMPWVAAAALAGAWRRRSAARP